MSFNLNKEEFDEAIKNKEYEFVWSAYESLAEESIIDKKLATEVKRLDEQVKELRDILRGEKHNLKKPGFIRSFFNKIADKVLGAFK